MLRISFLLIPILFTAQACNFLFGDLSGEQGSGTRGIFRSHDSASTWEAANKLPNNKNLDATQVASLAIEAGKPANLLAATLNSGLLASDNGGDSWVPLLNQVAVYDAFIARDGETIFAAGHKNTVAAIFKSADRGKTWAQTYGESTAGTAVTALKSPNDDGKILYAGLSSGTLLASVDGGTAWHTANDFKDRIVSIAVPAQNSQMVLVLTQGQGLRRSTDGGKTWGDLIIEKGSASYSSVTVDPKNAAVIYVGSNKGLYRSENGGGDWTKLSLPATPANNVMAVAVNPQNSRQVFAAIRWTVYRSDDSGGTWRTAQLPTRRNASDIVINPLEPNKVYVGFK